MLNREKFAKEILDIVCSGDYLAVKKEKNVPVACDSIACVCCAFHEDEPCDTCREKRAKWCNSEYTEYIVDWSKVPVDTPILVRQSEYDEADWQNRYFAKYEDGKVYAWPNGTTSWSSYGPAVIWKYARLAD